MAKEIIYRGKSLEELKKMGLSELAKLLPARARRSISRGFSEEQKKLLKKLDKKVIKTHRRDMIIIPEMVGKQIKVHNGKDWIDVNITLGMLGHYLGEFAQTRRGVKHSGPGIGATRSSKHQSVK